MNQPTLTSSILAVLLFVALQGCAQVSVASRLVDVSVVNRTSGERLTPHRHEGKLYIAGAPGDAYSIELRSRIGERILTVVAVDGVNVLSGETAAPLQSGYVLDAGRRYAISGWRKSLDDVAQFVFTALPESYAARTGRPADVGVIGVAVFREKPALPAAMSKAAPTARHSEAGSDAASRPGSPASAKAESDRDEALAGAGSVGDLAARRTDRSPARGASPAELERSKRLGTGHGQREYAPTRYTAFLRNSDTADEIITIYYDSRVNLVARGIIPSARFAEPRPFPAGGGFVPDPRG